MKRSLSVLLILFSCVGCDQATKYLASRSLPRTETFHFLGDSLRLRYTENPGAFLSLGERLPGEWRYLLLTLLVGVVLVGLFVYLLRGKSGDARTTTALALILGGGVGNLIDRLAHHGRVVDFLNVGIGPLRTGIFNVADLAITCGVLWLGLAALRGRKGRERPS